MRIAAVAALVAASVGVAGWLGTKSPGEQHFTAADLAALTETVPSRPRGVTYGKPQSEPITAADFGDDLDLQRAVRGGYGSSFESQTVVALGAGLLFENAAAARANLYAARRSVARDFAFPEEPPIAGCDWTASTQDPVVGRFAVCGFARGDAIFVAGMVGRFALGDLVAYAGELQTRAAAR